MNYLKSIHRYSFVLVLAFVTCFFSACEKETDEPEPVTKIERYEGVAIEQYGMTTYFGNTMSSGEEVVVFDEGVILLDLHNMTYERLFSGHWVKEQGWGGAFENWSIKDNGSFIISADSSQITFNNDPDIIEVIPGYWSTSYIGDSIYYSKKLRQQESISYKFFFCSGVFIYKKVIDQ